MWSKYISCQCDTNCARHFTLDAHSSRTIACYHVFMPWRHQVGTFSASLALCQGGFPLQRPMIQSFDAFFNLRLNKRLNKQSRLRWVETPSSSLWLHCNASLGNFVDVNRSFRSRIRYLLTLKVILKPGRFGILKSITLQWRHNEQDSVSNHQPHDCLLNRLFRRRSKKTSKLRVTGLCAGNSPGTVEFPARMASNTENVSIWWRHHVMIFLNDVVCQIETFRYMSNEHVRVNSLLFMFSFILC